MSQDDLFGRPDVQILIGKVGAALQAPRVVPARQQNEAVSKIYSSAHNLRSALRGGFLALEQSIGAPKWGEAFDQGGPADETREFLRRFEGDLDRLISLANQDPVPTKDGKPGDHRRTVAMARIVAWYSRQNGNPPPRSKDTRFMEFASEVFRRADPKHDVDDLSAHLNKVLKLQGEGLNLETWAG
ncbi:hypothetical protein [Bradyrhizobium iriomotense]|uniref:Histidine kinase n=1 Tax=Bradyrhizobium iriomotense TaxID=441950 RepID=A0ABQ6BFC3_9BRAD|nr:hypothetical protein [Bradyrhizobium iriomotense]GLR91311.1 hypothetical protein GCM10007857_80280 [Bradyrhizobium iriomotense]